MIPAEMPEATTDAAPRLAVESVGVTLGTDGEAVRARWRLTNQSPGRIDVWETWLPHGRFFGERQAFNPALSLLAGERATINRVGRLAAERGETIENAFLNLQVRYDGRLWRVLTRMRVARTAAGSVNIVVEAVTVHHVGFAQEERQQ